MNILLSLGPKFALPYTNANQIPFFHLIADVEHILAQQKNRNIRDDTRCQIINNTQNYIHRRLVHTGLTPLEKFCNTAINKTKQFIRSNPDILITEADKGNRTVIMYLDDYNNKMLQLLNDTNTYKPCKSDPTSTIKDATNTLVKRLATLKLIDNDTIKFLTSKSATCPMIYGQPKAHKAGLPLRPVVPTISSPTYNLSKYIATILKQAFTSCFNVKDSKTFCTYVNNLQVPAGHIIVSFDVVSLFTNVPQHLFYTQIFGTAMGSPLSSIAADIVTEQLLTTVTTQANIPAQHIRKYVDDLFLVIPEGAVDNVLKVFNSYDQHLQFTCEVEQDRKLPFLDMLIIRNNDNTLSTDC
ncbi:uncharacterized protein LOC119766104 [Culex quinquefasciatus]|uniref:uncharacterized protein LOC119766104 n=1 Tax=Culex quinquefasciatus TaxID=7176 RepID=UPI0018E30B66|nr:uncharacterized protein LOC119766104 [Culex quinquefasciatus]